MRKFALPVTVLFLLLPTGLIFGHLLSECHLTTR